MPVAPSLPEDAVLPMRERLVNARVLTLLGLLRASAELRYRRDVPLNDLGRRLLSMIGGERGLTSVELVALTGQEKAQVSRAIGALTADGLVERVGLRAPVRLTPAGEALYARVMAIGTERDAALTRGIAAAELKRFHVLLQQLIERAALLLAQERDAATDDADAAEPFQPDRLRMAADRPFDRMVAPPLNTLSVYLSRSATLAYRRDAGLASFAWKALSQVGEHQPLTLARLIALLGRDKSQVGRAVKALETDGLVARARPADRREVVLSCTAEGNARYADMCRSALGRDDFLLAELGAAERDAFVQVLDRLTANAQALLAAER